MPGTGPVYQPTTVTYEPRPGLLAQTAATVSSPMVWLRRPLPQIGLLVVSLVAFTAGMVLIVDGAVDYEDTVLHRAELLDLEQAATAAVDGSSSTTTTTTTTETIRLADADKNDSHTRIDVLAVCGGVLLTIAGICGLLLYVKVAGWRRGNVCPCGLSKKHQLARQMQQQCRGGASGTSSATGANATLNSGAAGGLLGGGQALQMNPSTDPLVSHTQYAPVSELPRPEDEECRKLMLDNKECLSSAEESDRMLDSDPRIVLRPLGHMEEI